MTDNESTANRFDQLRKRAEELINARPDAPPEGSSTTLDLINELQIHQVEVEIQNEELKQAQQALSALHREYEDLYEFAPCGYVTLDAKGIITRANLTAVTLLGVDRSALLQSGLIKFISPEGQDVFIDAGQQAVQTGEKRTVEVSLKRNDSATLWVRIDIVADRDETGAVTQWRMAMTDITEHKTAEAALRSSREELRQIIDLVPHFIFSKDAEGRFLLVNRAVADAYGTTVDALMGKTDADFAKSEEEALYFRAKDLEVIQSEKPQIAPDENITDADGNVRSLSTVKIPFRFSESDVPAMLGVSVDITDRKQMEDALKKSEKHLRLISDNIPALVSHVDGDLTCLFANRAYLTYCGLHPEELIGKKISEVFNEEAFNRVYPYVQKALKGEFVSLENHLTREDGHDLYFQINYVPHFEANEVVGYFVLAWDITKRKRAEAALQKSLSEKEVLLREIHHRVKNNMQNIISLLRMHGRRIDDARVVEIFNDCRDRIEAMSLIHEALYQSENLAKIDFKTYLEKLCRNLARAHDAPRRRIDLTANVSDVSLTMDRGIAVGMVIAELISNAFKHAFPRGEGGTVSVRLDQPDGETARLVVSDTGKGLPEDFDIQRLSSLGMRLVWGAVTRELSGTIDVEGNDGARFIIRFKCHTE